MWYPWGPQDSAHRRFGDAEKAPDRGMIHSMLLAAAPEPINSYLIQCVVFMAIVPVIATIIAIAIVLKIKKRSKQEAIAPRAATVKDAKR